MPSGRHGPQGTLARPFTKAMLGSGIVDLLAASAHTHAGRIAIDDGSIRLSYSQVWDAVRHLAQRIAGATRPGELVGVILPNCTAFPIAMMACVAAGRPCVPIYALDPASRQQQVIEDSRVTALVGCFGGVAPEVLPTPATPWIDIDLSGQAPEYQAGNWKTAPLVALGPDEPAWILYTSGSSGRPKGIVNSQRGLLRRVEQFVNSAHITDADRILSFSSDCTIAGVRDRLTALLTGATAHVLDTQQASPRQMLARLEQDQITVIYAVPALLRSLVHQADGPAPACLRVVRLGGESVLGTDIELFRKWLPPSCLIQLGYGSTEAQVVQWFIPPDFPTGTGRVPVGYWDLTDEIVIVGEDGQPAADGDIGELVVRSPYVALARRLEGEYVRADYPADPFKPGCRSYYTGDLARMRPDGLLELAGRKDRQIKVRGLRVEPGEVEAAILRCHDIRDAAVIARTEGDQTWLIAYVATSETPVATLVADVHAYLRDHLPSQLRPHRLYVLPAIPRLSNAKLDLAGLRAVDGERRRMEALPSSTAPVVQQDQAERPNSVEHAVEALWRRSLKRQDIPWDADFFDMGGDSLSAIDITLAIEAELGVELPITALYLAPTVAALSCAIRNHSKAPPSPLVLLKDGDDAVPALFIVHGVGGNVMELFPLGRSIDHAGRVFAVQSRGLDGREEPIRTVADMADYYWTCLRAVQPTGPYYLSGYSFGGLVAYEIARLAHAAGETVGMVALLDTTTNIRQWPATLWMPWLGGRVLEEMGAMVRRPVAEWRGRARSAVQFVHSRLQWRLGADPLHSGFLVLGLPTAVEVVARTNLLASSAYQPAPYGGRLTLINSVSGSPYMCSPTRIWRRRGNSIDVHKVPGTHVEMVRHPYLAALARVLSDCLRKAGAAPAEQGR